MALFARQGISRDRANGKTLEVGWILPVVETSHVFTNQVKASI